MALATQPTQSHFYACFQIHMLLDSLYTTLLKIPNTHLFQAHILDRFRNHIYMYIIFNPIFFHVILSHIFLISEFIYCLSSSDKSSRISKYVTKSININAPLLNLYYCLYIWIIKNFRQTLTKYSCFLYYNV